MEPGGDEADGVGGSDPAFAMVVGDFVSLSPS